MFKQNRPIGRPGQVEYRHADTSTLEGLKYAEKLKEDGWLIISQGLYTITFARLKEKYRKRKDML